MQQLKISFFQLQTLKNALLFRTFFRKKVGACPTLTPLPHPDHYKIIFCPPLAKVLVGPLTT